MEELRSPCLKITMQEVEEFIFSYQEKSEYHLAANKMATAFMEKYPDYDFESEYIKYKKEHPEVESLYVFIASVYFGFHTSLKDEYHSTMKSAKERVKMYKDRIKDLSDRIAVVSPSEKYKREKLVFFRDANSNLLELAKKDQEKKAVFRKAVSNCRRVPASHVIVPDFKYSDYRQYEHFDIRRILNYGEAPAPIANKIHSLKNDMVLFSKTYRRYFDEFDIINKIKNALQANTILQNRCNLFNIASSLFEDSNYEGFAYLMVPQIEGLFVIYCKLLGISDIENRFSITEKLQEAYEKEQFFGFVYYCYDFPRIRNHIAHGNIIPISEVDACELLSDIYYIVSQLILPLLKTSEGDIS